MRSLVCFDTPHGRLAVAVEAVRGVRDAVGLVRAPQPRPGVAGLLDDGRGGTPLAVLDVLGPPGRHVLVLEVSGVRFGVHVERVVGVERLEESSFGAPPRGQAGSLVTATARLGRRAILVVDEDALAALL